MTLFLYPLVNNYYLKLSSLISKIKEKYILKKNLINIVVLDQLFNIKNSFINIKQRKKYSLKANN